MDNGGLEMRVGRQEMRVNDRISKKLCRNCQREFEPIRKWQTFCTEKCRYDYHNDKKLKEIR